MKGVQGHRGVRERPYARATAHSRTPIISKQGWFSYILTALAMLLVGGMTDTGQQHAIASVTGSRAPASLKVTGPTRMVNTKTYTLRAELLDALGETDWRTWTTLGTVTARRVSDQSAVPTSITIFETFPEGVGAGGPPPDSIRFYNGLGSVSITLDDPDSVAGEDIEVTVTAAGFSDFVVVTVLDDAPGLFKTLSGNLSGPDLTWSFSDGVIHVTADVTVGSGKTLTIEPGTLIMVDAGPPGNGTGINVEDATLSAVGTEADPIFFFATNGPAAMELPQTKKNNPESWRGISHSGSGTATYANVFWTGSGNGEVQGHPRPVIMRFSNAYSVDISDCVFADNPGKIIHTAGNGTYTVSKSLFSRAGIGGEFRGAHDLLIEDSWFTRIGRAPEPSNLDGDMLHLNNAAATQLVRRSIFVDGGDEAIDHNLSFPVVEDSIIWNFRDKAFSLTKGGVTIDNVLAFHNHGIDGLEATDTIRNSTFDVCCNMAWLDVSVDKSIILEPFLTMGSCSNNINYTLGTNQDHFPCGAGNLTGDPQFKAPAAAVKPCTTGPCDYNLKSTSPAAHAGPGGGKIGWLGFPEGVECVTANDCNDGNPCTNNECNSGTCQASNKTGSCNDGNPCTTNDTCSGGSCQGGPPPNCNDNNVCTDDSCDPASGCLHIDNSASCNDGLSCSVGDICSGGVCSGMDSCPPGQSCDPSGDCKAVFVFQDGNPYTGTQDTSIRQGSPDENRGALENWDWDAFQGGTGGENVGLLRFDDIVGDGPGQIPPNYLVASAMLTLVVYNSGALPNGDIYELQANWDELLATWNNFGGDPGIQPDEIGNFVASAPVTVGTADIDVTASLQAWVNDPSSNLGWVFLPNSSNGVDVRSSEYAVQLQRPKLRVELVTCNADGDCDDGQFCNGTETCSTGVCRSGTAVICDDDNPCTTDSCDVLAGCSNDPIDCDDGLSCTADGCNQSTGQCESLVNPGGCLIDTVCYDVGQLNPANECEVCDGTSPTSWTSSGPTEVVGVDAVRVDGATRLNWTGQGIGFVYDVAGEDLANLHSAGTVADAVCLANDVSVANWEDPRPDPQSGQGHYYLLRSQKSCGAGSYGPDSSGKERQLTNACP